MSKKFSLLVTSLLSCLGLAGQVALAAPASAVTQLLATTSPVSAAQVKAFQLQPRLNVWGFAGSSTVIEEQFLAPLYGDQSRAFYIAVEGNYVTNDSSWLAGAGLGYRQVVSERIWGGYALADYVSTPQNGFTIINPGLEMLGTAWDVRVNGYIPLDNKRKLGELGWAGDRFDNYTQFRCEGHECYDHMLQQYEEPGRGFDFEVARIIPYIEDAKLHVGAYHFDTSDAGSTNGGKVRLTYDLGKNVSIELKDSYDNTKHNQFFAGLRITLGGYSKEEKQKYGISARLMDPIALSGRNVTLVKKYVDKGEYKEHDNVWFFKQSSSGVKKVNDDGAQQGSGTAEDPFTGFTPENFGVINPNIGVIDPYPLMYFAPGAYSFSGFSVFHDTQEIFGRFNLPNGWGMYGRTAGYTRPAMGNERATFTGGLDLNYATGAGTEPTTLNSIRVLNNKIGIDNAALYAVDAGNAILQNIDIENAATAADVVSDFGPSPPPSVYGVYANNSNLNFIRLNDSTDGSNNVLGSFVSTSVYTYGYGIYAENAAIINFTSGVNTITGLGSNPESWSNNLGYGIYALESTVNFSGGNNVITGHGTDVQGLTYGYGIYTNQSTLNFDGGANTITGLGTSVADYGYGIYAESGSTVTFRGGNNVIIGEGLGSSYGTGYGIYADESTINFANSSDSKVTIHASGGTSSNADRYGVVADPSSHIQRSGVDLPSGTTFAQMQEYINFDTSGGGLGGKAVSGGVNNLDIDWP